MYYEEQYTLQIKPSYANSQVVVKEDELTSLDRGFDQNDEHVWGSEYGPYIFKKLQ